MESVSVRELISANLKKAKQSSSEQPDKKPPETTTRNIEPYTYGEEDMKKLSAGTRSDAQVFDPYSGKPHLKGSVSTLHRSPHITTCIAEGWRSHEEEEKLRQDVRLERQKGEKVTMNNYLFPLYKLFKLKRMTLLT